jgi:hypothetical protein
LAGDLVRGDGGEQRDVTVWTWAGVRDNFWRDAGQADDMPGRPA